MTTQEIWNSQSFDAPRVSIEYVRHLANELRAKAQEKQRKLTQVLGFASVLMLLNIFSHPDMPLRQAAFVCIAISTLIELLRFRRKNALQAAPAEAGVMDSLKYYRQALVRQREMIRTNLGFSLMVGSPGLILLIASFIFERRMLPPGLIVALVSFWVVIAVAVLVARQIHLRRFDHEIAAADLLMKS